MKGHDESLVADGLMSIGEAMAFLSVGRSTLYELMDKGLLPYVNHPGQKLLHKSV